MEKKIQKKSEAHSPVKHQAKLSNILDTMKFKLDLVYFMRKLYNQRNRRQR